MYEIGFVLPFIIIIGLIVFLAKEGSEQAYHDREINRLIQENSNKTKEYFNRQYGEGTIK